MQMAKTDILQLHGGHIKETGHRLGGAFDFRKAGFIQFRQRDGEDTLTRS